jgi:hypothetical protein
MKKLVFAFVMALASISLVSAPTLRAQDSDQITIKDPAEFNAYQMATTQSDPKAKAASLEGFLQSYPQSVVKSAVLDLLVDTYHGIGDSAKELDAAIRLLQMDPSSTHAIFNAVLIKKAQCAKTGDAQICDDAAVLAHKGLLVAKPAKVSDDDWKKQTGATFPIFHSTIGLDDAISKKDFAAAVTEYKAELMLYTDDQNKTSGLLDTLHLAEAYANETPKDLVNAIWFYSRAWDFAPAAYKPNIEKPLEYYYKKYHGGLDGLDDIKAQAATTTFPPGTYIPKPALTPAEQIHNMLTSTSDWSTLALGDKETVLALGSKDDADKLWALLKDKPTPVPGIVIEATASVIKLAVTQDAKDAKLPDFIVNMKKPLEDKEIPAAGAEFGLSAKGQAELDGIYDTYTQIPATDTVAQRAEIVLRDGVLLPKKAVPAHKPTPAHKPAAAAH